MSQPETGKTRGLAALVLLVTIVGLLRVNQFVTLAAHPRGRGAPAPN